jgi:hypothetical protein
MGLGLSLNEGVMLRVKRGRFRFECETYEREKGKSLNKISCRRYFFRAESSNSA